MIGIRISSGSILRQAATYEVPDTQTSIADLAQSNVKQREWTNNNPLGTSNQNEEPLIFDLFQNSKVYDPPNETNETSLYDPLNIDHVHDLIRVNNLLWEEKSNSMTKTELKTLATTIQNTLKVHIKEILKYEKHHMHNESIIMSDIKELIRKLENNKLLLVSFRDVFVGTTEKVAVKRILENETFDKPTKKTKNLSHDDTDCKGDSLSLNAEFARKLDMLNKREIVSFIKDGIYLIVVSEIYHYNMRISKIEDEAAKFKELSGSTTDVDVLLQAGFQNLMNEFVDGLVLVKSIEEIYENHNVPLIISSEMNARYKNLFETADYIYKIMKQMNEESRMNLREKYIKYASLPFGFIRIVLQGFTYSVIHEGISDLPIWNFELAPKVSLNQMIAFRTNLNVENLQRNKPRYYEHSISKRCSVY